MKTTTSTLAIPCRLILLLLVASPAFGQGTAFTYNGLLNNNDVPANGPHDMRFTLYDANAAGVAVGGPLTISPVDVVSGLFTVRIDFGANIFTGPVRWLHVEVRPVGGADYTVLAPRQEVLSSPYAIRAASAGSVENGAVTANQLNTGGIAPTPGQFLAYNGGNLFWSDPGVAAGNVWSLNGNSTFYNAGNVGIGSSTPAHRLGVAGGPFWTANQWLGAVEFPNGGALGWQANQAGQRFGMGHTSGGFYLFRTASNPGTTGSPAVYDLTVNDAGNVGIGTTTPSGRLQVVGDWSGEQGTLQLSGHRPTIRFTGNADSANQSWLVHLGGPSGNLGFFHRTGPAAWSPVMQLTTSGRQMEIYGQDALGLIGYQPFLTLFDSNAGYAGSRIQSAGGEMILAPQSYLTGSDPNAYIKLFNSGNLSVKSLTIRGGADLAEPFAMSQPDVVAGSVVVIDEANPGKLRPSTHAYDKKVAGIVSGANGIEPGISLYQEGKLEGGQNVALSGRVYVLADASSGAITPGDLLTTSNTPGHAMKVSDHTRSQGAILGKAMSALEDGRGMVLVLVTLQ